MLLPDIITENNKNLPTKPTKGGIPARDKNTRINNSVINCKLPKPLNSFNVLKYLTSNKKKIPNKRKIKNT